jgi:hypothetical protein
VTYSTRHFIVGPGDILYRLASKHFAAMLDDPENHRLPRFAGERVRLVEAIVELRDRVPCEVVRLVYEIIAFDAKGRIDSHTFVRQNWALAELHMNHVLGQASTSESEVIDASSRFIAQGGRWQPSQELAQRIVQAALGEIKCEPL